MRTPQRGAAFRNAFSCTQQGNQGCGSNNRVFLFSLRKSLKGGNVRAPVVVIPGPFPRGPRWSLSPILPVFPEQHSFSSCPPPPRAAYLSLASAVPCAPQLQWKELMGLGPGLANPKVVMGHSFCLRMWFFGEVGKEWSLHEQMILYYI